MRLVLAVISLSAGLVTCLKTPRVPPTFRGLPTIDQMANAEGFNVTHYEVFTDDGYSLWFHRIGNSDGPPVLVHHPLTIAADCWLVVNNRESNIVFILLDNGFDVWLTNSRGTVFNEFHLKYSKSDPRFWDFSFHEIGYYDLPAFIDKILEIRKKEKLFYLGQSLSTTALLVMGATRPEYNDKIQAAVLMSPIAYFRALEEMIPLYKMVSSVNINFLYDTLKNNKVYDLTLRSSDGYDILLKFFDSLCHLITPLCYSLLGLFLNEHKYNLKQNNLYRTLECTGAGMSTKTLLHLAQGVRTGDFRYFDYGEIENMKRYNQPEPPEYNMTLVTIPIAIYSGAEDVFISEKSVRRLSSALPNLIESKSIPSYSHIDTFLGFNAQKLLYPKVVNVFKSYSKTNDKN